MSAVPTPPAVWWSPTYAVEEDSGLIDLGADGQMWRFSERGGWRPVAPLPPDAIRLLPAYLVAEVLRAWQNCKLTTLEPRREDIRIGRDLARALDELSFTEAVPGTTPSDSGPRGCDEGAPCTACGRPRSPDHDADAPGPTVRHPYRSKDSDRD